MVSTKWIPNLVTVLDACSFVMTTTNLADPTRTLVRGVPCPQHQGLLFKLRFENGWIPSKATAS